MSKSKKKMNETSNTIRRGRVKMKKVDENDKGRGRNIVRIIRRRKTDEKSHQKKGRALMQENN